MYKQTHKKGLEQSKPRLHWLKKKNCINNYRLHARNGKRNAG